jgi:nucleoside-diphosphate-sugar epimerase
MDMRIFLAGATGALGTALVPKLVAAGHYAVGSTRSADRAAALHDQGAAGVVMEPLDEESVRRAVAGARPDVVIHQLTALSGMTGNPKRFDEEFAETNRLRTTGLDLLVDAARRSGATRFLAQSFTGWPNARTGPAVVDESAPLDPHPAKESRKSLAAIRYVEETVPRLVDMEGLVLRYGGFYGHGTGATGAELLRMVRRRRFPVVGDGAGMLSFVHIADAADATVLALTHGAPGLYNIVDDDPAPVAEWLPKLAELAGARTPRHLPGWLARPMIGEHGMALMTTSRGSSNAKARRELRWTPGHPSWREGFAAELEEPSPTGASRG